MRGAWDVRSILMAAAIAFGVAAGTAYAMSEWWVPKGKSCPTFDSEDACKSYCRADQSRCGGEVGCSFKTGDKRPEC
jgi:hypothetical protein